MPISALSSGTVSSLGSFLFNRASALETSFSSQQNANISADNQGNSLLLSLSSRIDYYEATYSIKGITGNSGQVDQTATDKTDSTSATQQLNFQATYLEMIRERVAYLLEKLANSINRQDTSSVNSIFSDNATKTTSSTDYIGQLLNASQKTSATTLEITSGYYSAEQTSQRIVQFALLFYDGGDRSEYVDMVKSAVLKGYNEAKKALGGYLPPVADNTIALAMEAFDQFAAGSHTDITA